MSVISFSIVIPAYNVSRVLGRAVKGIEPQMAQGDEVIIVDDCSEDETLEVAKDLVECFGNIKIVTHEANLGRLEARRTGVQNAFGTHVLFLDADDEFAEDTLSILRSELLKCEADILHFGLEFIDHSFDEGGVRRKDNEKYFAPFNGSLNGSDIFKACFVEGKYAWNLVNKCFDASLCRKAFNKIPKGTVQRGEDAAIFFVASFYAKKYRGLKDRFLYKYHFGSGQDSFRRIPLVEYRGFLNSRAAYDAVRAFLDSHAHDELHEDGALRMGLKLVSNCALRCKSHLSPSDRYEGIKLLIGEWGPAFSVAALREQYRDFESSLFQDLPSLNFADRRPDKRFIATYYHQVHGGGVEGVLHSAIRIWKSLGYRVLLFLDKEADGTVLKDMGVDASCVLPPLGVNDRSTFKREESICQALDFYDVDRVIYHAWVNKALPWDLITLKSYGVAVCIHCHGIFSHFSLSADPYFAVMPRVYAHADAVVSLSETDASFWRMFNDNVHVTINPPTFSPASYLPVDPCVNGKTVLWLARVSPEKKPEAIVSAFEIVAGAIPDATLIMVGSASSRSYEEKINKLIESSPVNDRIEKVPWTTDQASFYSEARVFVMTGGAKEGYPLTLVESKTFGLPCVMFDLPYLTLVRDGRGIKTVAPDDIAGLANEIIEVLSDDELCSDMGNEARKSAEELSEFDFSGFWQTVFASMEKQKSHKLAPPLIWETLLLAYSEGTNQKNADLRWSKGEISGLNKKIAKYKKANSWKIGRAVTWLPRKVKKTVKSAKRAVGK